MPPPPLVPAALLPLPLPDSAAAAPINGGQMADAGDAAVLLPLPSPTPSPTPPPPAAGGAGGGADGAQLTPLTPSSHAAPQSPPALPTEALVELLEEVVELCVQAGPSAPYRARFTAQQGRHLRRAAPVRAPCRCPQQVRDRVRGFGHTAVYNPVTHSMYVLGGT
eukprot:gene17523-53489_t